MSEAASSEVVTQGSSAAAVAARDVPWSENVAAAEAKLAAMAAEGKAPPEPTRRDRVGKQRGEDGRFKAGEAASPAAEAAPAEEATEPADEQPEKDDDARPVAVSERAKWREYKRRQAAAISAEREAVAKERQEAEALRAQARELLEAKESGDPLVILRALGITKDEWAKRSLRKFSDPEVIAEEKVAKLRAEMEAKERAAMERAAQAEQQAERQAAMTNARALLAKTHPGLERSNVVPYIVAELEQLPAPTNGREAREMWEAVVAHAKQIARAEYEALHAHFGAAPATPPPAAKPAPVAPARRAISPGNARSASAEPATAPRTQAERDRAWAEKWGREMAKTMG